MFGLYRRTFELIVSGVVLFGTVSAGQTAAIDSSAPKPTINNPPNNQAQTLLTNDTAKEQTGLTAEALKIYRQAAALEIEGTTARRRLASVLSRDPATRLEAEQLYEQLSQIMPKDFALTIERADNLARTNDSVKAILLYRRAFELDPESEVAINGYLRETTKIGAAQVAIEQLAKQLAKSPENLAARLQLAELLRGEARYKDALGQYRVVQRQSPDNIIALRGVAEAWLGQGYIAYAGEAFAELARRKNQTVSDDDRARLLIEQNRWQAALNILRANSSKTTRDKRELPALLTLADVQYELNDLIAARATLEQLLRLLPAAESPERRIAALERLARISYRTNDETAMRAACGELLSLDESNGVATLGLQLITELPSSSVKILSPPEPPAGLSDEAQAARRAAFDRAMGEAALFWSKPEPAKTYLQRAAAVWTRSPRLSLALAAAFQKLNELDAAFTAYSNVDAKDGVYPRVLLGQADIEMKRDHAAQALTLYRYVLRLDPANLNALAGEASALERALNYGESAALFADLTRRAPEVARFEEGLTKGLAELGRSRVPASATVRAQMPGAGEVRLTPGDKLRVQATGKVLFDGEAEIKADGYLSLPFLTRTINARCLKANQLQIEIAKLSRLPISTDDVKVRVVAYARAPLAVAGAVYIPNIFYVRNKFSLRQSLMLASGTKPEAGNVVYVVRDAGGGLCSADETLADKLAASKEIETYFQPNVTRGISNLTDAANGSSANDSASDSANDSTSVQAGDMVFVPDADAVFIYGAVARPQIVKLQSNLTLMQLVRAAGGTLTGAQRHRVKLFRLQRQGATSQRFAVNLDDIEENRLGDVILLPGDRVEIPYGNGASANASLAQILRQAASAKLSF